MKRVVLWLISMFIFCGFSIYFCIDAINIKKESEKLYDYFRDNELLDSNNSVNLSSYISKKESLEEEIVSIFNEEDINAEEIFNRINQVKEENEIKASEIEELSSKLETLKNKATSLETEYNTLNKKYNELVWQEKERLKKESTVLIENAPKINQYPNYPTGCESVALTILLRYYGINVSPDNVINNLKKGDLPYYEGEVRYGGNPELEFVGNPYSESSYGVFENPIADVASIYKSGVNVRNGVPFSEVLALVKNGRPVLVWTSIDLAVPYISSSWIYKPTMETIYWKTREHAVVVFGYNDSEVIISDPVGGKIKYQNRSTFESRYNYYGKKVVYY